MEAGGRRRKGQRLLYYFRTPPSVRVGREALDPEAMRMLEQNNPDISFDWERLLKSGSAASGAPNTSGSGAQGSGAAAPGSRRERRDQRRQRDARPPHAGSAAAARPESAETGPDAIAAELAAEPLDALELVEVADSLDATGPVEPGEPADLEPVELQAVEAELELEPELRTVNLENPEPGEPVHGEEPEEPVQPEPVEERYAPLGADGLRRLRARYADLKSRLEAKPIDEAERVELIARLERLNPDAWQTHEDVARGIDEYEMVFESFRGVVGRPPRRRRL